MGKQWLHDSSRAFSLDRLLVDVSPAMEDVRLLIKYAAAASSPIMICGPSGSGKEVVANAIHLSSPRKHEKFVAVNCGAIPSDLLESELFGHEKGSFTGAISQRIGRFEDADQGSLLLDEIGDMPLDMQVKLLRVLEDQQIQRVGSNKAIKIDTHIISATHKNIDAAMAEGSFREDLFFRLSVFPIELPALKERTEDIPLLMHHFLAALGDHGRSVSFTDDAIRDLMQYDWPGNVRELRNIAERAAIFFPQMEIASEQINVLFHRRTSNAPTWFGSNSICQRTSDRCAEIATNTPLQPHPHGAFNLRQYLLNEERKHLISALDMADGVVAGAARLVGMQRTTFVEKMRRHEITRGH